MRALRAAGTAAVLALTLVAGACGDDSGDGAATDGRPDSQPDALAPDAPVAVTFTAFVVDLVQNQSAATTDPRPFADFATLDDPDSANPAAYAALFP